MAKTVTTLLNLQYQRTTIHLLCRRTSNRNKPSKDYKVNGNKERRFKLATREWYGILARLEDEADLMALSTGWTGDMIKCMLVRNMRLNNKFAYLHSLRVDGKPPEDDMAAM